MIKQFRKISQMGILIAALIACSDSRGQTSVHSTAHFNNYYPLRTTVDGVTLAYTGTGSLTNDISRTIEMWFKRDIVDNATHVLLFGKSGAYVPTFYIEVSDTTMSAHYGSITTNGYISNDTNWHHVAYLVQPNIIPTTTPMDSNALYIDGNFVVGNRGSHISAMYEYMYIGSNVSVIGGNYWRGNIAKVVIYDSALYSSSFTPDCVYDTTVFYNTTTQNISYPCVFFAPLNGNDTAYSILQKDVFVFPGIPHYSYNTSPCAPTYTFYCPVSDTIHYTGVDTVLKAVNTNASYMKGSNIAMHKNGWLNPSTTFADFTTGIFTDTLVASSTGIYPYISSYSTDTEKVVIVIHDSTTSSSFVTGIAVDLEGVVYPNPATSYVTIRGYRKINASTTEMYKIELLNILGQVVLRENPNRSTCTIDISRLETGIYQLRINDRATYTVVKQ